MFCALGLVGGLVLGFVGGLVLGSDRGLVFGSGWPKGWGGGGGFPLALANTVQVFLGTLDGGEEEATGHLVELGVVWVFHLTDPHFAPVDTGDGAHLHARGVQHVDFGADEGVVYTIPPPPLGGVCLAGGVGLCGQGGLGGLFLVGGGVAPSDESWDSKCHLELFLSPVLVNGVWGGWFGLRGWGAPLSPLPHPPNHPPPSLPISPHPAPPCTPCALTWPTPQPCTSLQPVSHTLIIVN